MTLNKKTLPKGYNEFLDFIEKMTNGSFFENFKDGDIETVVDRFLEEAYRKRVSVARCLLQLLLDLQTQDYKTSAIAFILSRCDSEKTLKIILSFMKSAEASDKLRRKLFLVLEKYQCTDKIPELVKSFKDKDLLAEYALNSFLHYLGPNGENLNTIAKYLENHETEFYHTLTANLTHVADESSLWLLGMLAEFSDGSVAERAIQALGYRKSPIAYEILENLIIHAEDKKNAQEKALNRLMQSNISKPPIRSLTPHKSYLSWIDGLGNRILLVSRRTVRGQIFMVTFLLNEETGIQDCTIWHSITALEMDSFVKSLEVQTGLKQIDYTLGVKFMEDALWKVIRNQKLPAPNFLLARRIFGAHKLTPRKYEPSPAHMGIEYVYAKRDNLIASSEDLLRNLPFSEWLVDTPEALEFVKSRPSLEKNTKIRKDVLQQFVRLFIVPQKEKWQERFLITADFLHLTSPRISRQQIETCLALYLTLSEKEALASIPFIIKLAELSIQHLFTAFNGIPPQGQNPVK